MRLSKSRYIQGIQCPKILWMREHMPEQFDEGVLNQTVLDTGSKVGDLAMGYFGDFVEVPFDLGFKGMIKRTRELMDEGTPVICEAAFSYEGNLCLVDILRKVDDGYELIEVKSSTHVKDINLHDVAYQLWVLENCGINVKRVFLMHIDRDYELHGELDVQGLFEIEDVTAEARSMVEDVEGNVEMFQEFCANADEPDVSVGAMCFQPYECAFKQWCWRNMPSPSVFDIVRMRKENAESLHSRGVSSFDDLRADSAYDSLTPKQKLQVDAHVDGLPPQIDQDAVDEFLDGLWYPLYFLDFETILPAVPVFEGTRPFRQVPTQYSLHYVEREGGQLEHKEFLAKEGTDPRRAIAERLVEDIPDDACVLAWNMGFEKGRLKELAECFTDLEPQLMTIHDHIRDLMVPFSRGDYYTKEMQGSSSIKAVLPALFPNDPSLDYHALEGVHNGGEAAAAFETLASRTPEEIARIREQLLRYCELDTLAMVRIWEKLQA